MIIITALAGLIATMFTASVISSLVALRHEDVNRNISNMGYHRKIF